MTLSAGDKLPEATFFTMTEDGPGTTTTNEVFGGKTVALFAVPGAFTPTCHLKHMPGFIEHADAFKAKGCDTIACITVNDPFVAGAWGKTAGADGKIAVLADADAAFTKAAGMDFDGSAVGLLARSKRYAAIVRDGVVETINIEDAPSNADISSAEALLKSL